MEKELSIASMTSKSTWVVSSFEGTHLGDHPISTNSHVLYDYDVGTHKLPSHNYPKLPHACSSAKTRFPECCPRGRFGGQKQGGDSRPPTTFDVCPSLEIHTCILPVARLDHHFQFWQRTFDDQ